MIIDEDMEFLSFLVVMFFVTAEPADPSFAAFSPNTLAVDSSTCEVNSDDTFFPPTFLFTLPQETVILGPAFSPFFGMINHLHVVISK